MSWLELEEKVALVTGGGAGIGRAVAAALAANGCRVVIADIKEEGDEVISGLPGRDHLYVRADVSSPESVNAMIEKILEKYDILDILVNNAGILIPRLLVDPANKYELDEKTWDKMVNVNQKGAFLCAQAAARVMIRKKTPGVIINMTSESGMEGSEGQSCYAATKGAMYAMTRSWAKELGRRGIRVVGVAPGIMEATELRSSSYEEALAYTRGITVDQLRAGYQKVSTPLGRAGQLDEVADLVCFLVSDRASYTTGTTYNISGGKTRA